MTVNGPMTRLNRVATMGSQERSFQKSLDEWKGVGEAGRAALASLIPLAASPNRSRFFVDLLGSVVLSRPHGAKELVGREVLSAPPAAFYLPHCNRNEKMRGISGGALTDFDFQKGGWGWSARPPTSRALLCAQRQEEAAIVFLSPKLVCDALDRASPDAERLGHLQDTHALRKLLSHLRSVVLSIFGRPSFTPWATARLRPALMRWRIMVRSNSAKAPVTWKTSLPIGVVVSMACWSRYKSTPHASRCWIVSSKSISERPKRSIAHAMTISNFRRLASLSMESSPGRPFRTLGA